MPSHFSLYYCDEHMPTGQTDGVMLTKKPKKKQETNKQDNNKLISTYSTVYANSKTSHWQLIYVIQNPKTQAPGCFVWLGINTSTREAFIHSLCKTVLFLFSGPGTPNLWGDATPKLC